MEPFEGIRVVELAVAVQGPGAGGQQGNGWIPPTTS